MWLSECLTWHFVYFDCHIIRFSNLLILFATLMKCRWHIYLLQVCWDIFFLSKMYCLGQLEKKMFYLIIQFNWFTKVTQNDKFSEQSERCAMKLYSCRGFNLLIRQCFAPASVSVSFSLFLYITFFSPLT